MGFRLRLTESLFFAVVLLPACGECGGKGGDGLRVLLLLCCVVCAALVRGWSCPCLPCVWWWGYGLPFVLLLFGFSRGAKRDLLLKKLVFPGFLGFS